MQIINENGNYAANIRILNDGPLVFTFDNMDSAGPVTGRAGWGEAFLNAQGVKQGVNTISFLESKPVCWYRRPGFRALIDTVEKRIDLGRFPSRISYGGSMGGYAAGAFAQRLGCDTTILLNPISTLNPALAPWEARFKIAKKAEWDGPFCDATQGIIGVSRVFLVTDPLFRPNMRHTRRFFAANPEAFFYRFPGVGHGMPTHMQALHVLKPFVLDILAGKVPDRVAFARDIRGRRHYLTYFKKLFANPTLRLPPRRANILAARFAQALTATQINRQEAIQSFINAAGKHLDDLSFPLPAGQAWQFPEWDELREMATVKES